MHAEDLAKSVLMRLPEPSPAGNCIFPSLEWRVRMRRKLCIAFKVHKQSLRRTSSHLFPDELVDENENAGVRDFALAGNWRPGPGKKEAKRREGVLY